MNKTVVGLIVVAILLLAVSVVWYVQYSQKPSAVTPQSITIGMPELIDASSLVVIANDQHLFVDNGLNVKINQYPTGSASVESMLNGGNDIALATEFVIVKNAFAKKNISDLGTFAKSEDQYQVIGRIDRGIDKVADLKGKKIGVPRGTAGEFYLGRFLELHGISLQDLIITDVQPQQSVDAIGNGTVDALLVWKPFSDTIIDQLGTNAVTWQAQSGQPGYWNAICNDDWAARHPELITRFLKALDQAAQYTIYHPDEARAVVKKWLKADDDYVSSGWQDTQFALSLDQSLITAMEDEGRWMINNNLTNVKTIPDYQNYLYLKGLEEVKPEAVNIIG